MAKELYEYRGEDDDGLDFYDDGTISVSAYSYCIDSWGGFTLDYEETKKLYLELDKFFKDRGI